MLVGASIGIAGAVGEDPVSIDQLLSNADVAAYRAKRMGRGRVEMFDDELRRQLAKARRVAAAVSVACSTSRGCRSCARRSCTSATAASSGSTARSTGRARASREQPDTIARVLEEAGMSRALDVALVRTVLAQLADWERRPPAGDRPRPERHARPATGALSPLLPELVRDMLARSRRHPVTVLARCPGGRGRARSRGRVAGGGRARRPRRRGGAARLRLRGVVARTAAPPARADDDDRGPARRRRRAAANDDDDASTALLAAIVQYARGVGPDRRSRSACRTRRTPAGCGSSAATSGPAPRSGRRSARSTWRSSWPPGA